MMFGSKQSGINAYAKVGLETGVVDASPLKLTIMLYEGAVTACIRAQQAIQKQDIPQKGEYISKAISIIESGLRTSLNKRAGGEVALNLDQLYEYMIRTLMQASLRQDSSKVYEVQQLLMELKGAWETLEKSGMSRLAQQNALENSAIAEKAQAYQHLAMAGA
ncbi:flagellar export chaperone FliS [Methylophilus sp. YYY-1]|uniref:Flagellar export chaperone FliS n=1 Tax=Methylophilus glucosoxydans TaxID=752553 RepID=A0ABW3GIG9_9PROT|nr:flagellar export chaperone FliS [Methylophilus sp. YYY-1]